MNRRDAYGLGAALIFALAAPASAGGFAPLRMTDPGETCYSWEGGHKSAGSFSKCQPSVEVVVLNQLPPPVLPSPIMMPQSAPMASCPPLPTPHKHKPIVKRKPRVQC